MKTIFLRRRRHFQKFAVLSIDLVATKSYCRFRRPNSVTDACAASLLQFLLPSRAGDSEGEAATTGWGEGEGRATQGAVPDCTSPTPASHLVPSDFPAPRLARRWKRGGAAGRGWRKGRGGHAACPVPAESRGRTAANCRATVPCELGGCGERQTETGDVFKLGVGGVSGGCSGNEDDSDSIP